ncbi:hypothetical protein J6590_015158 [Homalodisca vitripennis]|nr:hypothetical protein J6590_015158 [Homalodisca vitripennis]
MRQIDEALGASQTIRCEISADEPLLEFSSSPSSIKNRCIIIIWATLWMSRSGTSLTANVEILAFMGNSIGMTVGVGGVCSLIPEVVASLNKDVPPPAYFDWRGWIRAGLPFFGETRL